MASVPTVAEQAASGRPGTPGEGVGDATAAAGRRGTNRAAIRVVSAGNGGTTTGSRVEEDGGYPPPQLSALRVGDER